MVLDYKGGINKMMKITDVQVRLVTKQTETGKLKATASIVIDDAFAIHDIKLIEGDEGVFMAMPSRKMADGMFRDIAHPINMEAREQVKKMVLAAYEKETTKVK